MEFLRSLWASMPWKVPRERSVLYLAAVGRDGFVALGSVVGYLALGWISFLWLPVVLGIVWCDVIGSNIRGRILGYRYNANVSAPGEWEGWAGPLPGDDVKAWESLKMIPLRPWDGNPH